MSTPDLDELRNHVEDSLGEHRDLLERLAELDTGLSEDALRRDLMEGRT